MEPWTSRLQFAPEAVKGWQSDKEHEGRGRPEEFSDAAIECCLVLRSLFHLALRATQGFVEGMIQLLDLKVDAPHYTLWCKRAGNLNIDLKALPSKGAINIVIDSTGLKIYGEGEWKVRVHGKAKRRSWKKLHLAVNPDTHEIVRCELTDHRTHDCDVIDAALPNQPRSIEVFCHNFVDDIIVNILRGQFVSKRKQPGGHPPGCISPDHDLFGIGTGGAKPTPRKPVPSVGLY